LDPALALSVEDLRLTMAIFEGLTRNDPVTARPIPGLAERWEVSPDGRRHVFHLRTNAMWSTGEPITADDFVYSWRRALDPATGAGYASQLFLIRNAEDFNAGRIRDAAQLGFRAQGPGTLQVDLHSPSPFFLDLCAFQTLAVVPRRTIEEHGDRWLRARPLPVSGPYGVEFWRLNDRVRLRKNPRYWDATNTVLEVVDLLPASSPTTAFNLYHRRAADIIWDRNLVPAELLDHLRQGPECHRFDYLATYFVRYNVTRKPFDDPRVRRAMSLVIDRQRIVERITRGGEKAAIGLVPPGTANHRPIGGLPRDPAAARRLLAEAGYPGGAGFPAFQYLFAGAGSGGGQEHERVAVELKEMWERELGIRVELRRMEKRVFIAAQTGLQYDVSQSNWVGDYNDPNTFLDLFLSSNGNNRTGWKNPGYDALLRSANAEPVAAKRAAILQQAEVLLIQEQAPVTPLYHATGFNYYDPQRVAGIHPNLLDLHPINAIRRLR
jgi:oligopeptide transport system substrate-binding protein